MFDMINSIALVVYTMLGIFARGGKKFYKNKYSLWNLPAALRSV